MIFQNLISRISSNIVFNFGNNRVEDKKLTRFVHEPMARRNSENFYLLPFLGALSSYTILIESESTLNNISSKCLLYSSLESIFPAKLFSSKLSSDP